MPKDAQEARAFKLAIIAGAVEAMAAAGAPRSDMVWHFAMMVQVGAQQMDTAVCFALKVTFCRRKTGEPCLCDLVGILTYHFTTCEVSLKQLQQQCCLLHRRVAASHYLNMF